MCRVDRQSTDNSIALDAYRRVIGLFAGGQRRRQTHRHCPLAVTSGWRFDASTFMLLSALLFFALRADQLLLHGDVKPNPGPCDPTLSSSSAASINKKLAGNGHGAAISNSNSNPQVTSHLNPLAAAWHPRQISRLQSPRPVNTARPTRLLVTNARSVLPKIAELRQLVSSTKPPLDILAITETWLAPCVSDSAVSLPGNCLHRRDRSDRRLGGGVAVYVRENLCCIPRPDLHSWSEDLWLEFSTGDTKGRPLLFGCYYRPPSSDLPSFLSALESTLIRFDYRRMDVLLAGDFNATSPSWLSTDSHNAVGLLLEQAFLQLGLTQHVFQPTHLRVNGGLGSTLDLILSSSPGCVSNVANTSPLGKSDHCVLYASVDFRPSRQSAHSRLRRLWAYDKADFGDINKRLLKADWPSFSTLSVDQAWITWKKKFWTLLASMCHLSSWDLPVRMCPG